MALTYIPAPQEIPADFEKQLLEIGGFAPNGKPKLRISWGMDLYKRDRGKKIAKYPPLTPGYFGIDRWVLEQWMAPTMYNKSEWKENRFGPICESDPDRPQGALCLECGQARCEDFDLLGEFPTNGFYGLLTVFTDDDGEFAPISDDFLMRCRLMNMQRQHPDNMTDLRERMRRQRKANEEIRAKADEEVDINVERMMRRPETSKLYSFPGKIITPNSHKETKGRIILPN